MSLDEGGHVLSARQRVADFWDEVINRFLVGEFPTEPPLDAWIASYKGARQGAVDFGAYPEPYHGRILGDIRGVALALNPGQPIPEFHYRDGYYAQEIRELRSFRKFNELDGSRYDHIWHEKVGRPRHRDARLRFIEQWNDSGPLDKQHLLTFELYPWHSKRITSGMAPDPAIIKAFILDPIAETGVRHTFAFGSPWFQIMRGMGLREVATLGHAGEPYGSMVNSRSVSVFEASRGAFIVVEKHSGSAGPPSPLETQILTSALASRGLLH